MIALTPCGLGQDKPPETDSQEMELSLDEFLSEPDQADQTDAEPSIFDMLGENLRVNVDLVLRIDTSSRRGEPSRSACTTRTRLRRTRTAPRTA